VEGVPVGVVDVTDRAAVEASARGADGAFLSIGGVSRDPNDAGALHRGHVVGTREALAGLRAAGVKRVVHVSTSGTIAVGTDPKAVYSEVDPTPSAIIAEFPYYRSKLYAEQEALEANVLGEFEVVCVNPSLLLGPGDDRESSTADIRRFLDREIPAAPAGGLSIVDVRDAARGCLAAYERGRAGERYLLNAKNLTVAQLFQKLEAVSGVPAPKFRLPRSRLLATGLDRVFRRAVEAIGGEPPVDEITMRLGQYFWYCDASKAEHELDFVARDPSVTLRDTVVDIRRRAYGMMPPEDPTDWSANAEMS
jgi:dihydroflavonol-4-reductase